MPRKRIGSAGKTPLILNTDIRREGGGNDQVSALVFLCLGNAVTDIALVTAIPKRRGFAAPLGRKKYLALPFVS